MRLVPNIDMTTWTKVSNRTTQYETNQNNTYYGTPTAFNESGVSFNQSGIRFNEWFTTYENRNVIYNKTVDPNYYWQYDANVNTGQMLVGRPLGLLLSLTYDEIIDIATWNDVDNRNTIWVDL